MAGGGPLAGLAVSRLGHRATAALGAAVAAAAFLACWAVLASITRPPVLVLQLLGGVGGGIGLGLVGTISIVHSQTSN